MSNKRTGLRTLRNLAYRTCQLYTRSAPVLNIVYASNPTLLVAIEAVNLACAEFVVEADKAFIEGK